MASILNNKFAATFMIENVETILEGSDPPKGITPLDIDTIFHQDAKKVP